MSTEIEIVQRVLRCHEHYEHPQKDTPNTATAALVALERIEDELKQSAYYRECRDYWRQQAESLARSRVVPSGEIQDVH